jgi:uncharacterized MAPEG superfamily protein
MNALFENPAMRMYALAATVVALHLLALAFWTGTVRVSRKQYAVPEDAKFTNVALSDAEHPDVLRVQSAHRNAIENAIPFFAIGLLYALSGANRSGAQAYFGTFVAARVLHSLFYLWGRQPFRTIAFAVGALATIGMGAQVLRAAM